MLEAGFLVLLAVVVGFADLSPALIILVMAVGWLLVSLIEYFAWRQAQAAVVVARYDEAPEVVVEEVAPPPPPPAPAPASAPAPPQSTAQPAAEEETIVAAPAAEPAPAKPEARTDEGPTAFQSAPQRRTIHRLEPLQPRPRRRWILFGPHQRRSEPPAEGDREEER